MLFLSKSANTNISLVVILTVIFPVAFGTLLENIFTIKYISIPIHSTIEATGGIIAIVISMIFYLKYSKEHILTHFNYATTALLAMGIIDIFHASVMPGEMFVWLHSTAVFFGGIFFMSVWFKKRAVSKDIYFLIPFMFFIFAILFSLLSIYFESFIPKMLESDNTFTTTANCLNLIGGAGFFIASVKFILNYKKTNNLNELLLSGHTMLFGIAGLLFLSSSIWDIQWWLWHVLRLSAYIIAFYFLYIEYKYEIQEVHKTNNELESANKKIVEYLDIVDKYVITSTTDVKGIIINVSQAFCDISGYSKEELIGKNHNIVRHKEMPKKLFKELWKTINSAKEWHGEILNKRKDGSKYWVETKITPHFDENNKVHSFTSVRHDITNKKYIETLSITDVLTNLYNRRYFNKTIVEEINRAKRDKKHLSFVILDVDNFKHYNDTYGHQKGDFVLQTIGQIINKHTQRTSDFAFRLGGEEFGIIFSNLNKENSYEFIQNILDDIEDQAIEHTKNIPYMHITASAGLLVLQSQELTNSEDLYMLADKLLYEAKESGRNRVVIN